MENVAPSGALARRSRQMLQLAFVIIAAGAFITVVGLGLYAVPLAVPGNSVYPFYNVLRGVLFWGGVFVALGGLAFGARAYFTRIDNDLARITGDYLGQYRELDERYWFIRNIDKRGLGYIDAVMVGPPGALVFRIVDDSGNFANEKSNWLKQNRNGEMMPAPINFTEEDVVDIKALRNYLTVNGLGDVPVYGVVVFTRDEAQVQILVKEPVVPVAHLTRLFEMLQSNYLAKERVNQSLVESVANLLYQH
jgi:hypothetical protein